MHFSQTSTFVRFSNNRRLFIFLLVSLFVIFILVIVVVWVLRWQAQGSDEAGVDSPGGSFFTDA
jgi:flagellar biogenesis protein FliO